MVTMVSLCFSGTRSTVLLTWPSELCINRKIQLLGNQHQIKRQQVAKQEPRTDFCNWGSGCRWNKSRNSGKRLDELNQKRVRKVAVRGHFVGDCLCILSSSPVVLWSGDAPTPSCWSQRTSCCSWAGLTVNFVSKLQWKSCLYTRFG